MVLKLAVLAVHDHIQVPIGTAASSILTAVAIAVQGLANVSIGYRRVPINIFMLTGGESGARKSTADRFAMLPIREREGQLRRDYPELSQINEIDRDVYERRRKEIIKISDRPERLQALKELGSPPQPPISPAIILEDPTPQGLLVHGAQGQASAGICTDEGARFLDGGNMSTENQLYTAAILSKIWDGDPIERTRVGTGQMILEGKRISCHLMAQESTIQRFLTNEKLTAQGLHSRFLTSFPDSLIGTRKCTPLNGEIQAALDDYHDRLDKILKMPLPIQDGSINILEPRDLEFSPEADAVYLAFCDEIEAAMASGMALENFRGFANKIPEQAVRLAGVLTLFYCPNAISVPCDKIEAGITIARYFLSEAVRITSAAVTDTDLVLAEKLLTWLQKREGQFSLVEIYQLGPMTIRQKDIARRIVNILIDHGHVRRLNEGREVNGHFRREVYELVTE